MRTKNSFEPDFLVVDLFAGAGGTTTGFEHATIGGKRIAKVIACVNHDEIAISSHSANHKSVLHFTEDIRTLELGPLIRHIARMQLRYPRARIVLWASLECTNFSKAKGGLPRDADSRTLAEHLYRYIEAIQPDYLMIENVEEFMSWGPLDANGKPISKDKGKDFIKWRNRVKRYGYDYEHRLLNSADYGAHTSRTRYFAIFASSGLPIVWPEPTHAKDPNKQGLFRTGLRKWRAVRHVLDLEDEGNNIFERKKPLSEKTLQRILAGLIKYVAGGKDAFLLKYYSSHNNTTVNAGSSPDDPLSTVTTFGGGALVKCKQATENASPAFMMKYLSNNPKTGVNNGADINLPSPTVTTQNRLALISWQNFQKDSAKKYWLDVQHSRGKRDESIERPVGSLPTVPKRNLVTAHPAFLTNHNYSNVGTSVDAPAPTLLASRRHYYIINPSWAGSKNGASIKGVDEPCATIVARQDKAPLYLTMTESGDAAIIIYETDSPTTVKIKEFMALYGIGSITMRMLKVNELKKIMGLDEKYVLNGNQGKQKWMIGNMVHPVIPRHMARCLSRAVNTNKKTIAA